MLRLKQNKITVIAGATASGKSGFAMKLAKDYGDGKSSVIINADSMQIYRGMQIITAQPAMPELLEAEHRLYGIIPPEDDFSAGKWLALAKAEIDAALKAGKKPIVVGGTGLYLKSLIEGISAIPESPKEVRQEVENIFSGLGKEEFHRRFKALDPESFEKIRPSDKQRMLRAAEVYTATGKPIKYFQQEIKRLYPEDMFEIFLVSIDRKELYERCDKRFLKMLDDGAITEVEKLIAAKIPKNKTAMQALGVKEMAAYLAEKTSLQEAIAKAQQMTRNYAKRQLTWFRNQLKNAKETAG